MNAKAMIEALRSNANNALIARDAIDDCFSPAWKEAHRVGTIACRMLSRAEHALAADPATRYGDWHTENTRRMMMLGYL